MTPPETARGRMSVARVRRRLPEEERDEALWLKIRALVRAGEHDAAVKEARGWVADHLGKRGAAARYLGLAELLLEEKAVGAALEEFTHFLELFSHDGASAELVGRAWWGKGWCLYRRNEFRAAAAAFARACESGTEDLQRRALLKRADSLFQAAEYDQAREAYLQFVRMWPESREAAQAEYQAAECLARQGQRGAAQKELEELMQRRAGTALARRAALRRCTLFEEKGEWERAVAAYTEFISRWGRSPLAAQAYLGRGLARYRLGCFSAAEDDFRAVLRDYPDRPEAERAGADHLGDLARRVGGRQALRHHEQRRRS